MTQDIQMRNNEAQRESRKRDKMEREMKQTKADLDAKQSEIKTMGIQIQRYKEDITKMEQQLKEQRVGNGLFQYSVFSWFSIVVRKYQGYVSTWNFLGYRKNYMKESKM